MNAPSAAPNSPETRPGTPDERLEVSLAESAMACLAALSSEFAHDEAALSAAGAQIPNFQTIIAKSKEALGALERNRAVFQIREWEKKTAKILEEGGLLSRKDWKNLRRQILLASGAKPLAKAQVDEPWALWVSETSLEQERDMIRLASQDIGAPGVPKKLIEDTLVSHPTMSEEQRQAVLATCGSAKRVCITEGSAGAGKSFTLNAIREIFEKAPKTATEQKGYAIVATALSWNATRVLEASAGLSGGRAIEGLVRAMEHSEKENKDFFQQRTLVIVDEAGLVGTDHMRKLLWHCSLSKHEVRVLLTGDSLQLNPVMAGNAMEALVEILGSARLDTIRRQKQKSHREAVKHFCYGRAENGLWTYWQQEAIHFSATPEERQKKIIDDYCAFVCAFPRKSALVLALQNSEVIELNRAIRARLQELGRVGLEEVLIPVLSDKKVVMEPFAPGDFISLRKNAPKHPVHKSAFESTQDARADTMKNARAEGLGKMARFFKSNELGKVERTGVFNRMSGVLLSVKKSAKGPLPLLRMRFFQGGETDIDANDFYNPDTKTCEINHNFCSTIYASQGQTVDRVFLMDSPYMSRRLAYVGMSRHTELCDVYLDVTELSARLEREAGKMREKAWKDFGKDASFGKVPYSQSQQSLEGRLADWAFSQHILPSDLLRMVAMSWAKDSPNPTAFIAQKRMKERRAKSVQMGQNAWRPRKGPKDQIDDLACPYPRCLMPKIAEPGAERSGMGFFAKLAARALPASANAEASALFASREGAFESLCASDERALGAFEAERERLWGVDRHGEARLFALDPVAGHPVSRYDGAGLLRCGDGEIPVFPNSTHFASAPLLLCHTPREAFIALTHYRAQAAAGKIKPEQIPSIACAVSGCRLETLAQWVKPGAKTIHVAWSQQGDVEQNQKQAQATLARLAALGHFCELRPKLKPAPSATPPAPARAKSPSPTAA